MTEENKLNERQKFNDIIQKFGDSIPDDVKPMIEDVYVKTVEQGIPLHEVLGITPDVMEVIYQYGYLQFKSGKYKEALVIFNTLKQLYPDDGRFIFAIAATHHYLKNYLEAAANYVLSQLYEPKNPLSYFHLYDCFLKAGYPASAENALELALVAAEADPKYHDLKRRIEIELNQFKKAPTEKNV